jgi:hypothetical protein
MEIDVAAAAVVSREVEDNIHTFNHPTGDAWLAQVSLLKGDQA